MNEIPLPETAGADRWLGELALWHPSDRFATAEEQPMTPTGFNSVGFGRGHAVNGAFQAFE